MGSCRRIEHAGDEPRYLKQKRDQISPETSLGVDDEIEEPRDR